MAKVIGTLTDSDIKKEIENGRLIVEEYDYRCIKQACYELRASNIYYLPQEGNKKVQLEDNEYILLKPHCIIVLITMEKISLPSDILGRILTKGSLFSLGISAVNTYADPGFVGRLGIVFQNQSNNYLKIFRGEPIAKIEFSGLHQNVKSPYRGQHGYETEIWPIKADLILNKEEIKKDKRIKEDFEEINNSYGPKMGQIYKRFKNVEKRLLITSILYFIFNFLLLGLCLYPENGDSRIFSPIMSILLGLGSNILFAIVSGVMSKK